MIPALRAGRRLAAPVFVFFAALSLALSAALPARAADAAPAAANPALEARMLRITAELRCLVCQNQTIADSHADLAIDLRQQVRELLDKGKTDAEIIAYMTDRYGDFVLYRPPFKPATALLWVGPAVLMVGGILVLGLVLRRRARLSADRFEPDPDLDGDAADPAAPTKNA
jgi:cytochrome c-type biogenesis protein CcmH